MFPVMASPGFAGRQLHFASALGGGAGEVRWRPRYPGVVPGPGARCSPEISSPVPVGTPRVLCAVFQVPSPLSQVLWASASFFISTSVAARMRRASDWRPARVTDGEEARKAFTKHALAPNGDAGRRSPERWRGRGRGGKKPESLMSERAESAEIMGLQDAGNLIAHVFAASVVALVLERAV